MITLPRLTQTRQFQALVAPAASAVPAATRRSPTRAPRQGELEITAEAGPGGAPGAKPAPPVRTPFLMLGLDLPPAPLYKDALERNIIPQARAAQRPGFLAP
jgi:hypothetical protein